MNTTGLFHKLSQIRASAVDDYTKCRQAIDAVAGELQRLAPRASMRYEEKQMLLEQLDELYARAVSQCAGAP